MRLGEAELARLHERYPYPRFSRAEYERRDRNVQHRIREHGLKCLLASGRGVRC